MPGNPERGTATTIGMSARLLTPDAPISDILDGYPAKDAESVVEP